MVTRDQIVNSLKHCSDAQANRISDRLQSCNVRIVKIDNSTELSSTLRTRHQVAYLMESNSQISRVEYYFNGIWSVCHA